jgi:hypothetical protein
VQRERRSVGFVSDDDDPIGLPCNCYRPATGWPERQGRGDACLERRDGRQALSERPGPQDVHTQCGISGGGADWVAIPSFGRLMPYAPSSRLHDVKLFARPHVHHGAPQPLGAFPLAADVTLVFVDMIPWSSRPTGKHRAGATADARIY